MKTFYQKSLSITLLLLVTQISFFGKIYAQTESDNLSDIDKAYILGRLSSEVKYNYVFYYDLAFDWDSLCQASLPNVLESNTFNEFVSKLNLVTAKLRDGHTSVVGQSPNKENWIKPLPFQTKRIGDRVFVTNIYSSDLQQKGIKEGVEILEIDGVNVIEYGNKVIKPYKASSTPQWSDSRPFSGYELTREVKNKTSKIKFKNKEGKTIDWEGSRTLEWDLDNSDKIFDYKVLKNNIGLLKINDFWGNDFNKKFDSLYQEILKTDKLIIDLRDNTGGNSGFADYILRHLSDVPIKQSTWSTPMYIAAHASWNYAPEWYMQTPRDLKPFDKKIIYKKPIVVLTNANTFSSSENFCATFRGMKRGLLIGSITGGSTGNPIGIELGNGIYAQMCTKNDLSIDGTKFIGIGIAPDIEVYETADIYLNGKDVVIEKALLNLK